MLWLLLYLLMILLLNNPLIKMLQLYAWEHLIRLGKDKIIVLCSMCMSGTAGADKFFHRMCLYNGLVLN